LQVNLSVTAIALVVVDNLTFNLLLKRLLNGFDSFNGQGQVEVIFHAILDFATLSADHLTALLATEDTVDKMLARGVLQSCLQSIEDQVEELLGILLLSSVRGLAIELLEGKAELHWVELCPLRELQVSDHLLQLMHHAVIDLLPLVIL